MTDFTEIISAPMQKDDIIHENTGIDVQARLQYTPVQLIKLLTSKGFKVIHIYPIHIHGVSLSFKNLYPGIHATISNMLQNFAYDNMSFLPFSTSFMLHCQKEA